MTLKFGSPFALLGRRFRLQLGSALASGALAAAALSYAAGYTNASVPVQIQITRPITWQDGDKAIAQWSTDSSFTTGVTSGSVVTLSAATTSNSFGIAALTAGYFVRIGAWKAGTTQPGNSQMLWSNTIAVGDTVAPSITTGTSISGYQYLAGSVVLTANEGIASWFVAGAPNFSITQLTTTTALLSWSVFTVAGTQNVTVQATDFGGNVSANWNGVLTVNANQPTLTPSSFTNVSNAALSTLYTSNTIAISGLQPGSVIPASLAGTGFTYAKNVGSGGTYQPPGSFTVSNGDTITLQNTSPSANNLSNSCTVTLGTTTLNWQVATPITTTTFNPSDTAATITLSNGNLTATGNGAGPGLSRTANGFSTGKHAVRFSVGTAPGWYGILNGTDVTNNYPSSPRFALAHDGSFFGGSSSVTTNFGAPANGDLIDIAWDDDAKLAWIRRNGTWLGTGGDPNASGPGWDISTCGSTLFPFWLENGVGQSVTLQAVSIANFTSVI